MEVLEKAQVTLRGPQNNKDSIRKDRFEIPVSAYEDVAVDQLQNAFVENQPLVGRLLTRVGIRVFEVSNELFGRQDLIPRFGDPLHYV